MTTSNPSQGSSFGIPTPTPDDITKAFQDGQKEGRKQGWVDVLDILHDDYMSAGLDPESDEAKAILTVTRRTAEKMREALGK